MGGVTAGKLAGQVLEVVARTGGRLEPAGDVDRDADGERVAADAGEVLAECAGEGRQIGGGGRAKVGGDDPAVVLNRGSGGRPMIMAAGILAWRWLHNGQGARES